MTFGHASWCEDERITFIEREFKVFNLRRSLEEEKAAKERLNPYDMIPREERVGVEVALEWSERFICWRVSGGRSEEYERLYSDVPASAVFEMLALQRSNQV